MNLIRNFEYNYGYLCADLEAENGHTFYYTVYKPNTKYPKRKFKKILKNHFNKKFKYENGGIKSV
ncbi:MAG: hypothetical protein ACFFDF_17160 [Candidatus Odinarchaeota archaeon]